MAPDRLLARIRAQLMADGVAFRPGPREKIVREILQSLREAIPAGQMMAGFGEIRLEPDVYTRPEDFDLQDWLAESSGIWREEPFA